MAKYSELVDDDLLNLPSAQLAPAATAPRNVAGATQKFSDVAKQQLQLADEAERAAADVGVTRAMAGQVRQDTAEELGGINARIGETNQAARDETAALKAKADKLREQRDATIVQPDRWKRILSGVVKVIGAIGAGAGNGGGAGIAAAMSLIDDKLNEELTDQLRAKAEAGEQVKETEGLISRIQSIAGDEMERDVLTANALLRETSERIAAYADEAGSAEEALKLRQLAANYAVQADEALIEGFKFQQSMRPKGVVAKPVPIEESVKLLPVQQLQALAADSNSPFQTIAIERLQKLGMTAGPVKAAPAPAGAEVADPALWASVPDTEKAKYRLGKSALDAYNRDSVRLQQLLEEHGTEAISLSPFSNVKAEMEALQASLLGSYKEIKELGALDTGVIQLTDRAHGDPTAWFTGGGAAIARLKATRDSLNEGFRAREAGLGLAPAKAQAAPPVASAKEDRPGFGGRRPSGSGSGSTGGW